MTPSRGQLDGRLRLRFAPVGGRTELVEAERTPPFHLQRLLYLDRQRPGLASGVVLNTTAGVFAGDRLRLEVRVAAGAAIALGTPAMTRIYEMPEGCGEIESQIDVEDGGYLEYLPRPTLLCRGAALHQRTSLSVSRDARLAYGEVLVFGRSAHGERHAYRELRSHVELCIADELAFADALELLPEADLEAPGMFGQHAVYATLLLICAAVGAPVLLEWVRACLDGACGAKTVGGASLLHGGHGVGVRVLGGSVHALFNVLQRMTVEYRDLCL